MRTEQYINFIRLHKTEALIHGAIWSFIGLLYAILFSSSAVFTQQWILSDYPYFFACIIAGTFGALMYSSLRLVVFISLVLLPVCIIYFINTLGNLTLGGLLMVMLPAGLLIGAAYGRFSKLSRVRFAEAKALTGLSAGFFVALLYLVLQLMFPDMSIAWIVGIMCPITGALYVLFVPSFIHKFHDLLPTMGDGALVGIAVAFFISLCLFVMAGSIDTNMTGEMVQEISTILKLLPGAILGGMIGAGLAGAISGFVLKSWKYRE